MSFIKKLIHHPKFYIVALIKDKKLPYILFIHGGPGLNCGVLEWLIEKEKIFDTLEYNVILYDQRNCGRSRKINKPVRHSDNIFDLKKISSFMVQQKNYPIAAYVGHSYGAKLLYDYVKNKNKNKNECDRCVFISTASNIIIPRINNLLLDLTYLKMENQKEYQIIMKDLNEFSYEKLWKLTEQLADVFKKNKSRRYFYWANLEWEKKVKSIQDRIGLPVDNETFISVRKDLYSSPSNFSLDFDSLTNIPHILINGFHDFIMNGASALNSNSMLIHLFYKSSHYPHIEEHNRFCEVINAFIKKN